MRLCLECGDPTPETKNHNRKPRMYCSHYCTQIAYLKRARDQEKALCRIMSTTPTEQSDLLAALEEAKGTISAGPAAAGEDNLRYYNTGIAQAIRIVKEHFAKQQDGTKATAKAWRLSWK